VLEPEGTRGFQPEAALSAAWSKVSLRIGKQQRRLPAVIVWRVREVLAVATLTLVAITRSVVVATSRSRSSAERLEVRNDT
jgi:hypothetical protein